MKTLLYLFILSAVVVSTTLGITDNEIITATAPNGQTTCEGDNGCDLSRRSPQFGGIGDPGQILRPGMTGNAGQVFNWYCNAPHEKGEPSIDCGTDKRKEPLTHEICSLQCTCEPDNGVYRCMPWSHCDGKELAKQCKCWGFDRLDKDKAEVICGKGAPEIRSTFTSTRKAAKQTGI